MKGKNWEQIMTSTLHFSLSMSSLSGVGEELLLAFGHGTQRLSPRVVSIICRAHGRSLVQKAGVKLVSFFLSSFSQPLILLFICYLILHLHENRKTWGVSTHHHRGLRPHHKSQSTPTRAHPSLSLSSGQMQSMGREWFISGGGWR